MSESDAEISAAFIDAVEASLGDLVPKDLFALARRGAQKDAVFASLGQFQKLSEEITRLRVQNIQMQAALGYAICAEDERHIIPSNPFKCGVCDSRMRAWKEADPPPPKGAEE